ncbi:hypothetical protein [Phocoenobacter skyensis]|uniref:Uncharacterized protein n=1 Tax=Phocoenobacter skyensis TaxID=97481 RepID=A0A1H7XLK7_9PAST|nr:hypothetical protein [Pasteurella skyensis]MDP8184383.1 hypothetical protein [Pasteurella skyensis]QLB22614.1 hypothetical protein A6B44_05095 [Pasteurella skyensis]SEM34067.1 hypothetical protein SAMN05444853_11311 [Pasteurella skyensis]
MKVDKFWGNKPVTRYIIFWVAHFIAILLTPFIIFYEILKVILKHFLCIPQLVKNSLNEDMSFLRLEYCEFVYFEKELRADIKEKYFK